MFYVPDTPWLIVLPIKHMLGRVPHMKAYLGGSDSPTTIPSALAQHKDLYSRYGHADRAGTLGGGSRLLLKVHMWQYGWPQPLTISVRESHTRLEKARQAAGKMRESRKDQLADRTARRRATLEV